MWQGGYAADNNGSIVVKIISSCGSKVQDDYLVELEDDAANAPDVTRLAPAELQDDLGRPVVPGGDHAAVVLPVERGRAEVDELDSGVPHPPDVPLVGGAVLAVPVLAHEQNVFRLQVSVSQMVFVEKLQTDLELIINHNCIVGPH